MIYKIGSNTLQVKINTLGAEIQSIVSLPTNTEVLWQADKQYWARHAPILFPIVGKLKNNKLKANNQEYPMTQHGFARDCEFSLVAHTDKSVTLSLKSTEQTLAQFPFEFELKVTYRILGANLECSFTVINCDKKTLPFSLGGHPAFKWPLLPHLPKKAHKIHFNQKESAEISQLKDGLIFSDNLPSPVKNNIINLDDALFQNDALIFKNANSNKIRYEASNTEQVLASIEMRFDDFNDLGIWTKPNADFICLEPWLGYSSSNDFDGDFNEKSGLIHLKPSTTQSFSFTINVEIN